MTTPPRTPIDRLTAVLADSRRYDDPFVKPSTDDLALTLAVVAAARALRERLTIDPGNVVSWGEWDTLDEALAKLGAKP